MRLIPLTPPVWQAFSQWFEFQPPVPKQGIFVAETFNDQEVLVGGVCIYETDGIYVVFEHFGLNPQAPPKLKHSVAQAIFRAAKSYLNVKAKVGFAWISFDGGVKMAADEGFRHAQVQLMTFMPGQTEPQPRPPRRQEPPEERPLVENDPSGAEEDKRLEEAFSRSAEESLDDEDDDFVIDIPKKRKKSKKKTARKKVARRRSLA